MGEKYMQVTSELIYACLYKKQPKNNVKFFSRMNFYSVLTEELVKPKVGNSKRQCLSWFYLDSFKNIILILYFPLIPFCILCYVYPILTFFYNFFFKGFLVLKLENFQYFFSVCNC